MHMGLDTKISLCVCRTTSAAPKGSGRWRQRVLAAPTLGTRHLCGDRDMLRLGQDIGQAGQGCGELQIIPAVAFLGQGLKWGPGPWAGWQETQGAGQRQGSPLVTRTLAVMG